MHEQGHRWGQMCLGLCYPSLSHATGVWISLSSALHTKSKELQLYWPKFSIGETQSLQTADLSCFSVAHHELLFSLRNEKSCQTLLF